MVNQLLATGNIAKTCACHSTSMHCNRLHTNSTCVTLNIQLFNDVGQQITIDSIARVAEVLPYNFIIRLTTIRRYKLALVLDTLFQELKGVHELYREDNGKISIVESTTSNTAGVRPASFISTISADSAIKRISVRPILFRMGARWTSRQ